jgi:hypothetical protein
MNATKKRQKTLAQGLSVISTFGKPEVSFIAQILLRIVALCGAE